MVKKKLRIGLLLNSHSVQAWEYKIIQDIIGSEHSEIVLTIINQTKHTKKGFLQRLWNKRSTLLFSMYSKLEPRIFKLNPNAFANKNLREVLQCDEIKVQPIESDTGHKFLKEDLKSIKTYDTDVLIKFGFGCLHGEILNIAKYGVWSYHHGDSTINRGGPPGVWEVIENWKETGVVLQILNEDLDNSKVLAQSFSHTDYISISRNKNNYFWKACPIIIRKLAQLHQYGEEDFFKIHEGQFLEPRFYYNRLYQDPKNWEFFKFLVKMLSKLVATHFDRFFYFGQWILLFKFEDSNDISLSFYKFKRLAPGKERFWADPFILERENKYFIFLEELFYKENKGKISVMEIDENGNFSNPEVVLEKDYHLSYPFLIEDNDTIYMIPESKGNKSIDLYECTEFPNKWELKKTLFNNISAVDTTIFKHNGTFWLFTNIKEVEGASVNDELFLYHTDSILGTWKPHPQNPIVSDVKCARPAGNVFIKNERIYRPAQNCTKHYGYGMQIMEILTLTKTDYEERHLQSIYPNWSKDLISTHTFNNSGKLTIIDAMVKRSKFF